MQIQFYKENTSHILRYDSYTLFTRYNKYNSYIIIIKPDLFMLIVYVNQINACELCLCILHYSKHVNIYRTFTIRNSYA